MARATSTAQAERLAAFDRATYVRVKVENPDGAMVDVGDLSDEDFFDAAEIEASSDYPISTARFEFWRSAADKSLSPLIEASPINVDSGGSYAPFLQPARAIEVEVATMLAGETPTEGDYVPLWEGLIDDWDVARPTIQINARDPLAVWNDTIIETVATYGDDAGSKNIDDVMQDILDAVFGVGVYTLTVVGTPTLAIVEYELANVSVLEAIKALADLIGWNVHWKWDATLSPPAFAPTLYEPDRSNTTASFSFGPDDYYDVQRVALGVHGIRNKGEVVYTDVNGDEQTEADTRSSSVAIYGTRFIRLDARNGSIINATQAGNLLAAVLDDTEDPQAEQTIEAAFHWPIELGDVHTYEANGDHYDTDQTWACFSYRHVLRPDRVRTVIEAAGKPSGGFKRWHGKESPPVRYVFRSKEFSAEAFGGSSGVLKPTATSALQRYSRDLDLPVGSILLRAVSKAHRATVNDSVEFGIAATTDFTASPAGVTLISTGIDLTHDVNLNGWDDQDSGPKNVPVVSGETYRMTVELSADSSVDDAQFGAVRIDWKEPVGAAA